MSALKALPACRAEGCFVLLFLSWSLGTCALAQDFSELDAAAGKALFERNWVQAPSSTASADGLGPLYNARSCAACHADGGGNSAPAAMNVVLNDPVYGEVLQTHAIAGLQVEGSFTIAYSCVLDAVLPDGSFPELRCPIALVQEGSTGQPLNLKTSLRRAPALHGMAALEHVPLAELQRLADPEDADGDGVSGRLVLVAGPSGPQAGRYGWKAQIPTLRAQIARALLLDLGLGSSLHPQPAGDCTPAQTLCLHAAGPAGSAPEVSDLMLDLLATYLASLPPPASAAVPGAPGEALFSTIGCAACHVPALQTEEGTLRPWSDLLLHDMGPLFADNINGATTPDREWRTAPLWGLGQATRFLHDARAGSIEEAILWHGGEAQLANNAYWNLNGSERGVLLEWLQGL